MSFLNCSRKGHWNVEETQGQISYGQWRRNIQCGTWTGNILEHSNEIPRVSIQRQTSLPTYEDAIKKQNYNFQETSPPSYDTIVKSNMK